MKKSKIVSLALAGTLTATALLAGTYAWTAISQEAMNEVEGSVNPGGRLHDDFNGTNKDIYVENFTSDEEGTEGAIIYARIRLDEYLEIGDEPVDADENDKVDPVYGTPSTWTTFKLEEASNNLFRNYFKWTWGEGETKTYLPTFNKNKDSLEADINGTIGGVDGDKDVNKAYDDYVEYAAGGSAFESVVDKNTGIVPENTTVGSKYGLEIYDIDEDSRDEDKYLNAAIIEALHDGKGGIVSTYDAETNNAIVLTGTKEDGTEVSVTAKVITVQKTGETIEYVELDLPRDDDTTNGEQPDVADIRVEALAIDVDNSNTAIPHTVKNTLVTEKVMTMAEWIASGSEPGNYWVYDKDGWAYWADGIAPGEATGCLLTGIERTGSIVDKYHYAINVTAEFATAGDWGEGEANKKNEDGEGFYINGITDNGLLLLNTIAGEEKNVVISADTLTVKPGESIDLTSTVKLGAQTLDDAVSWSVRPLSDGQELSEGTQIELIEEVVDGQTVKVARLTIGEDETLSNIWVTASLARNSNVTAETMITIAEKLEVTVDVAGGAKNLVVPENIETLALDATVRNQWGVESVVAAVTWELVPESYTDEKQSGTATISEGEEVTEAEEDTDYTYIDTNGVLHIGTDEKSKEIQVVAKVDDGGTIRESEAFDINLSTQLEYISSLTVGKEAKEKPPVIVDGVAWYVLRKQDIDGDLHEEALLWAQDPVGGWQTGGQVEGEWVGWSYYGGQNPFTHSESDFTSGKENWWKYSNLRAWLNSAETKTGVEYKDAQGNLINSTTAKDYDGFLKGKDIISANAEPIAIYTRKEFDLTGAETDFDVVEDTADHPGDKVFVFTQADIYGTAPGKIDDGSGTDNLVYNADGTPVDLDYTVDSDLPNEIYGLHTENGKWHWLRSPRYHATYVSVVDFDGSDSSTGYDYSLGYVRPALWLNLSSSAQ